MTPDIVADFSSVIMQRSERDMQKGRTAQLELGEKRWVTTFSVSGSDLISSSSVSHEYAYLL